MKTIQLLFITISFLFMSCEDKEIIIDDINGNWSIIQVDGGLMQSINYNTNVIVWNIDLNTNTLVINNTLNTNVSSTPNFNNNESGSYDFTIEQNEFGNDVLVVGDRRGVMSFNEEKLVINYGIEYDDIQFTLIR